MGEGRGYDSGITYVYNKPLALAWLSESVTCQYKRLVFTVFLQNMVLINYLYAFFLSPMISFIPIIIRIGKIRAAKIPSFRLSFNALEIIPT